jgi:hypothetical protein
MVSGWRKRRGKSMMVTTLIPTSDTRRQRALGKVYALIVALADAENETAEPGELLAEKPGTAEAGEVKTDEQLLPTPG